ncbi:MAG: Mur ligase domain-containing protein, partial [Rubrimonas sp.]
MPSLRALGLDGLAVLGPLPAPDLEIGGIVVDSRETRPGDLFAAMPGAKLDGAEFAPYALRMGAVAVLASLDGALRARDLLGGGFPVPFLIA